MRALTTLILTAAALTSFAPNAAAYCIARDSGAIQTMAGFTEDCCDGRPYRWDEADQPVPVVIYDQTDPIFIPEIEAAIDEWNSVASSTITLELQDEMVDRRVALEGEILVGFDPEACEINPNCGLAGTSCATDGAGTANFRITSCTIMANDETTIWMVGPSLPDPRWVMTHELGHTLGLIHPDATPNSAAGRGCGAPSAGATMACCPGQQDAGTLELDDIAAVTALYPAWRFTVEAVNSFTQGPIEGATVQMQGTCFPHDGIDPTEGGMVFGDIPSCLVGEGEASATYHPELTYVTGEDGRTGVFRLTDNEFCYTVSKEGYKPVTECQTFFEPGDFEATIELVLDLDPADCTGCSTGSARSASASLLLLLSLGWLSRRRAGDGR